MSGALCTAVRPWHAARVIRALVLWWFLNVTMCGGLVSADKSFASLSALLKLAWPIVVSMLSVSTMTLTNMLFVSRLGASAIAAVGLGGILLFSLWCFPMGLVRAVKILISRAVGSGERHLFSPYTAAALQIAMLLGLIVTAIGLLGAPLLVKVTETKESGELASVFLGTRILTSVPFLCLVAIQEVRQGQGDSRTAMFTTVFANVTNIALDYVFVIRWGWGVQGAAWASNIALTMECVLLSVWHCAKNGIPWVKAGREYRRGIWQLGIPSGIQFGLEVTSFGILVLILASFSEQHAAAHQIGIQVLHFCFLPAMALGEAGSVLVGQAHGAGRTDLIGKISLLTLRVALVYATACGLVLFFGRELIVAAFTNEPALYSLALGLFVILPIFQFVDAANVVGRALLRGAGDVRFVAIAGIVSAWICTPPLTYVLGRMLGYGVYGAWVGLSAEVLLVTAVLWYRLLTLRAPHQHEPVTPLDVHGLDVHDTVLPAAR
jgi:multidrug resistance protein, MATE family